MLRVRLLIVYLLLLLPNIVSCGLSSLILIIRRLLLVLLNLHRGVLEANHILILELNVMLWFLMMRLESLIVVSLYFINTTCRDNLLLIGCCDCLLFHWISLLKDLVKSSEHLIVDELFAHACAILRCADLTRAIAFMIMATRLEGQALVAPLLGFIISVSNVTVVFCLLLWNNQISSRLRRLVMVLLMFEMMDAGLLWLMR